MQARSIHHSSTQVSARFNHVPQTMWRVWLPPSDRGWAASPSMKDAANAFEVACHRWSPWPESSSWRHNSQLPECVYVMAFKLVYFVQFEWKIIMALAYVQAYILMLTGQQASSGEQANAADVYRLDLLLWQQQNVKCVQRRSIVIIIELSYRIVIEIFWFIALTYRNSTKLWGRYQHTHLHVCDWQWLPKHFCTGVLPGRRLEQQLLRDSTCPASTAYLVQAVNTRKHW